MQDRNTRRNKVTIEALQARKGHGPKITRVNCYDALTASLLDEAGIDMILVGESVGRYLLGYDDVSMVTFDDIVHHAKAVRRGTKFALLIADLPLSAEEMTAKQVVGAGRHLLDIGMDAVKIEGGDEVLPQIEALAGAGIPVHGTLRYDRNAADAVDEARRCYRDAVAQVEAGCFMMSFAHFPRSLARLLTERVPVPTIGVGSGPDCDGQVVVINELVGYTPGPPRPIFKRYAHFHKQTLDVLATFKQEVENEQYPDASHWHDLTAEQIKHVLTSF